MQSVRQKKKPRLHDVCLPFSVGHFVVSSLPRNNDHLGPPCAIMASSLRSNRHSATESQLKYSKRQGSASVEGRKPSCTALLPDGKECRTVVGESHHRFCRQHHREQLRMYNLYKLREGEYNAICVDDNEDDRTKLEEKIRVGEEAVKLRDAVNRRFHSLSGDNRGHIGWILNLRSEIDNLKGASLRSGGPPDSSELSPAPSETKYASSEGGGVRIYKSLISPEVPMSALDHLPRDSPAVVIKASLNMMISSLVDKLSEIAPSLDDSGRSVGDANTAEEQDAGPEDLVVRYILRELLVWKADTETLAKASQTSSIDQFLRRSTPDELEEYIKLFEALGRPDTLHLLRDAVYDYLLLDGSPSTVTIRGASISRNTAERRMTADGWDILHQNFWNLIEWCNVEQLYFSFEDVALVKRLLALRRYDDSEANWFRPSDDVSQECEMAVLQGFDALSKGFSDPPYQQLVSRGGMTTKKESRCYLVGRMGKSDTLALPFIKEISTRVARFIVIAIDMERADWWRQCDPQDNADGNPFITRSRSAKNKADLHNIAWSVEWSAKDNLEDVRQIRAVKDREAFSDFHLIIIIDRLPGRNFTILEAIAEALKEVAGDRTCREIMDRAIRESIPASEREAWSAAVPDDPYSAVVEPGAASPHYEGHRVRQWDLVDKLPGFDKNQARLPQTYAEVRFIRKVLAEMESAKAITLLETFEAPVCAPMLYQSIDGRQDLFFPYRYRPPRNASPSCKTASRPRGTPPPRGVSTISPNRICAHTQRRFSQRAGSMCTTVPGRSRSPTMLTPRPTSRLRRATSTAGTSSRLTTRTPHRYGSGTCTRYSTRGCLLFAVCSRRLWSALRLVTRLLTTCGSSRRRLRNVTSSYRSSPRLRGWEISSRLVWTGYGEGYLQIYNSARWSYSKINSSRG